MDPELTTGATSALGNRAQRDERWRQRRKNSANDYFVSLGWGYNDLDRGFFPRAGNKSSLSGKVTPRFG